MLKVNDTVYVITKNLFRNTYCIDQYINQRDDIFIISDRNKGRYLREVRYLVKCRIKEIDCRDIYMVGFISITKSSINALRIRGDIFTEDEKDIVLYRERMCLI